jgi:hypothetical protein
MLVKEMINHLSKWESKDSIEFTEGWWEEGNRSPKPKNVGEFINWLNKQSIEERLLISVNR